MQERIKTIIKNKKGLNSSPFFIFYQINYFSNAYLLATSTQLITLKKASI